MRVRDGLRRVGLGAVPLEWDLHGSCDRVTDDWLAVVATLPLLRVMNLWCCPLITDAGVAHLSTLTQLQTLLLSCCRLITDAGRSLLRSSLPKLTRLTWR